MKTFLEHLEEKAFEWCDVEHMDDILEHLFLEVLAENDLLENLDASLIRNLSKKVRSSGDAPWAKEKIKDFEGKNDPEKITALYQKYTPLIKDRLKKYQSGLKSALRGVRNAKILVDVKTLKSFLNKTIDRGRDPSTVNDWLRGSILVDDEKDIGTVSKNMFKAFDSVSEFEPKQRGDDKQFGYYGSVHFTVDVGGVDTEVQVMTKKLFNTKNVAHAQYDDFRSASDEVKNSAETKKKLRQGKRLFDKGNKRGGGAGINIDKSKVSYDKVSGLSRMDRQTRRKLKRI